MSEGTVPTRYITVTRNNGGAIVDGAIIHERVVSIFVNGKELATMMCTPLQQDALALGFLANEGVIDSLDEVGVLHVCGGGSCVDIWLNRSDFSPPRRMILTSGCGGGVTFDDLSRGVRALKSGTVVAPEQLWALMGQLNQSARLYSRARGVHTSALSDGERLLITAEDVGRHNTLDKVRGLAMLSGIDTRDRVLLTTGRISYDMVNKARRMNVPVVCSRTSPTSMSIALADRWGITLVGYVRRNSMNIYTHPERVSLDDEPVQTAGSGRTTEGVLHA